MEDEGWRNLLGETVWRLVNGEECYVHYSLHWEELFDEPCPITKEEWERDVKGKSAFELMPKEKWVRSSSGKAKTE